MSAKLPLLLTAIVWLLSVASGLRADQGALAGVRHRVLVSTDIGGTDFDDFQSLVHLLLYSDVLDIEGLISSPYGAGRKEHILEVLDCYEKDFPILRTWSSRYPTPEELRLLSKQGETETAPYAGYRRATEGSDWIVKCARREDPRPLHVLIWGGIEDLAQALHDAPDILPKLRVHFIGGPNKKWSPDAYQYLVDHHPSLWIIESNATYRGWFVGGNQSGGLASDAFIPKHAPGRGALGDFFAQGISFEATTRSTLKMGDTPTVAWLLRGEPDKPFQPSWGGRYVRAWKRPQAKFERLTTEADQMEIFGILELILRFEPASTEKPEAWLVIGNQKLAGQMVEDKTVRFRFCAKDATTYHYTITSNVPTLEGLSGAFTTVMPSRKLGLSPDPAIPNWWTDDPSPNCAEGPHHGARTVNEWREQFLTDFAERLERCKRPPPPGKSPADLTAPSSGKEQ